METIPIRYATAICVAALFLGGCGGAQSVASPAQNYFRSTRSVDRVALPGYATQEDVGFDKSSEHLSASHVHIGEISVGGVVQYSYKTKGAAAGPYPGRFTASGGYGGDNYGRRHGWYFNESFVISANSVLIKGHISFSGLSAPKFYEYKVTILNGSAKIHRAGRARLEAIEENDFSETLRGL